MITIIIADAQEVFREGLKLIIEQDHDLKVVGNAKDGKEAVELCRSLLPDAAVLDLELPVYNGVECVQLLKMVHHAVKVIILATFCENGTALETLQTKADGYVLKDIKPDQLRQFIKDVVRSKKVPFQTAQTPNNNIHKSNNMNDTEISALEAIIIRCILNGRSNSEIASLLKLNETYIEGVINNLLQRFQLKDRTELLQYMLKENWLKR